MTEGVIIALVHSVRTYVYLIHDLSLQIMTGLIMERAMSYASKATNKSSVPLYKMVRHHILKLIEDKGVGEGGHLPSEKNLVEQLKVSRMTVNRALSELANEGYVERIAGVGTFAVENRSQSHPLEIHSIAEEIELRGHVHDSKVVKLDEVRADSEAAVLFNVAPGTRLFHSVILHFESGLPIQVEERYILPQFAPEYLQADFSHLTPTDYLLAISSAINEIEQIVQATIPDKALAKLLDMGEGEPCLVLLRRTWVDSKVVTRSIMHHPAGRFQFGGRYNPS